MLAIKFLRHMIDDGVVPILAAEPVIAIGRDHVDVLALDAHDRNVERTTTKVEDENGLVLVQFIQTVGERGGSRLVDNLQNIEAGELTGCDSRSSFREIGRASGRERV